MTINAPNLGTLQVSSNLMKPRSVEITRLGKRTLVLKPKAKARRLVRNGRSPRAKLRLELPPYFDGTELQAKFRKRLNGESG